MTIVSPRFRARSLAQMACGTLRGRYWDAGTVVVALNHGVPSVDEAVERVDQRVDALEYPRLTA